MKMKRNVDRLEQYYRRECIEIAGFVSSITNELLQGHALLSFEKFAVVLEAKNVVAGHRLEKTTRVIVKLLNIKDSQYILEKECKLRNIMLYNHDNESLNSNRIK